MPTDPRHTSHVRDAFAGESTSCGSWPRFSWPRSSVSYSSFWCFTNCVLLETGYSSICGYPGPSCRLAGGFGVLLSLFLALAESCSERLLPRRQTSRLTPRRWKVLELTSIPKQTTCLIRRGVGSSWSRENETDFSKYDAELVNFGRTLQSW